MSRILFVLHYPGYLRYFDSTIGELADRGHEVLIGFESPHKQAEGMAALEGMSGDVRVLSALPKRGDVWEAVAVQLRSTIDFARYLHPRLAGATYLRSRMATILPRPLAALARIGSLPPHRVLSAIRAYRALEGSIPSSPAIERYLEEARPDVVVVSPLVTDASRQTDVVKSARALGIPTVLAVASWDHLTTKGLIRLVPDRVLVWNEIQKEEALTLHDVDPERIRVTGAQPFDRWFRREPKLDRGAFCTRVGLPPDRPYVLFTGSTSSISEPAAEQPLR